MDAYFSLGLLIQQDGTIGDVRFFSPAFKAKLVPGEKIAKINDLPFSPSALDQALMQAKVVETGQGTPKPVLLTVRSGNTEREVSIAYTGGERFPTLERDENRPDSLSKLLAPMTK